MADSLQSRLPPCGLYRTTRPLPGHESGVPSDVLVYFHNHSDQGLPRVVLPAHIVHNRWHFHGDGVAFRSLSWAASLRRLPKQGLYVLREELPFEGGRWPKGALVQLGYNRAGEPLAFIAQTREDDTDNRVFFVDRGIRFDFDRLRSLSGPLTVYNDRGPRVEDDEQEPDDG